MASESTIVQAAQRGLLGLAENTRVIVHKRPVPTLSDILANPEDIIEASLVQDQDEILRIRDLLEVQANKIIAILKRHSFLSPVEERTSVTIAHDIYGALNLGEKAIHENVPSLHQLREACLEYYAVLTLFSREEEKSAALLSLRIRCIEAITMRRNKQKRPTSPPSKFRRLIHWIFRQK